MDIGGIDVVLLEKPSSQALDICVLVVREYWSDACYEDALTEEVLEYKGISFGKVKELLVYKDECSRLAWQNDCGPDNSMIYFVMDDKLSVVVDSVDAEMKAILESIRLALSDNRAFW